MPDVSEFLGKNKSLLIAPAGYGKTHFIGDCLEQTDGKSLILTHTHAGVASIKEKLKKMAIPRKKYNVETIDSYAQRYVEAFYVGEDLPDTTDKSYFPFMIKTGATLLGVKPIRSIVGNTYSHLFVDEYQDCTISQHTLILMIAEIIPTHLLGDPLQGIFGFNERLINLENDSEMGDFSQNMYTLEVPWRWRKENKDELGHCLKCIRDSLTGSGEISLSDHATQAEIVIASAGDKFTPGTAYYNKLSSLSTENSVLIIHPVSSTKGPRIKLVKRLYGYRLIESIDDVDFYDIARAIDDATLENIGKTINDICYLVFYKGELDNWFNNSGKLKRKQRQEDKDAVRPITNNISELEIEVSLATLLDTFKKIDTIVKHKCIRRELFQQLCIALEAADYSKTSVLDAMVRSRNRIRRTGRKLYGKCVGTTLLTKGLEFDTVVVLDAHLFNCKKNFYVAITRGAKRLIIFSENNKLTFPD